MSAARLRQADASPNRKGSVLKTVIRHRLAMTLSAGTMLVACLGAGPVASAAAGQKPLSCTIVPPAEIKATLGLTVSKPTTNHSVLNVGLNCSYAVANTNGTMTVAVNFLRPETAAAFRASQKGLAATGGTTKTVAGLGQMAYVNVMGSGQYALNTLFVLQDNTKFFVNAAVALTKEEALARWIVPRV
jgi:hypothetical protein